MVGEQPHWQEHICLAHHLGGEAPPVGGLLHVECWVTEEGENLINACLCREGHAGSGAGGGHLSGRGLTQ